MTLQELSIIFFFGFLVFVGIVAYFSSKQKASGVSARWTQHSYSSISLFLCNIFN